MQVLETLFAQMGEKDPRSATVFAAIASRDHSKAKGITNKAHDKKETKRNKRQLLQKRQTKKVKEIRWTEKKPFLHYVPQARACNMNFCYMEK